jgi:endonuclease I
MRFLPLFTSYLASRLPCPHHSIVWSKEHVIPKSIITNKRVTEHPRNILPMPRSINNARGNRPYTADWKDGYAKYSCPSCPYPGFCRGAMLISPEGAHPPDLWKGPIARSVLFSVNKHPSLTRKINDKVLNLDTALKWDHLFPMSKEEYLWLDDIEL